ncbi:MAG: hypothetical protein MJY46_05775 [Bacteroidales bacterium]|nr:hypothetical protein [Bacteroidales bacterium]
MSRAAICISSDAYGSATGELRLEKVGDRNPAGLVIGQRMPAGIFSIPDVRLQNNKIIRLPNN